MIGIRFEIPNEFNQFLNDILENIEFKDCLWKIETDDIIKNSEESLFDQEIYKDPEFRKIISSNIYYITFANLQCYTSNNFLEIRTYENFLKSDCYMLLIIVDNTFVDIYAKDSQILNKIRQNAIKYSFKNINRISDPLDPRNIYFI